MRYLLFISALIAATLSPGCKKKNDNKPVAATDCRIVTMNTGTQSWSIIRDGSGRTQQVAISDGTVEEYNYRGDTVRVTRKKNGLFDSRMIIINNNRGMARVVRTETNPAGTAGTIVEYSYDGTNVIQSLQRTIGSAATLVTIYNWENGNLTDIVSGSDITLLEYYDNKEAKDGSYLHLVNLMQGYTIFKTRNMIKSLGEANSIGHFEYTFDANGNVLETKIFSATSTVITLTYNCD